MAQRINWHDIRCPNCGRWCGAVTDEAQRQLADDTAITIAFKTRCSNCKIEVVYPDGANKRGTYIHEGSS